jgi:hypothetical protein
VITTLFNLVFVQSLISLCREFDEKERSIWCATNTADTSNWLSFQDYTANMLKAFKNSNVLNSQVANLQNKSSHLNTTWTLENAKNYVQTKCMHFLKIASLLQYYLYDQEVAFADMSSFDYLVTHLGINYECPSTESTKPLLKWAANPPTSILDFWIKELIEASETNQLQIDVSYWKRIV